MQTNPTTTATGSTNAGGAGATGSTSTGNAEGKEATTTEKTGAGATTEQKTDAAGKATESDSLLESKETDTSKDKAEVKTDAKAEPELVIKFPDGVKVDDATLGEFKALAKELGLKGEQAQKAADFYVKAQAATTERSQQHWAQVRKEWTDQARADKELGGDKLPASVEFARKTIARFGGERQGEAVLSILKDSGLDNHPEMLRFLVNVGKQISEDNSGGVTGNGGKGATSREEFLRGMYPTMHKKKE
jgi:hypothetical protein